MVEYEWDVEELDAEVAGEIVSHYGFASYAQARTFVEEQAVRGVTCLVALVRDADASRAWAYVCTTYDRVVRLPSDFQDAFGNVVCAVPKRFHREVAL